MIIIEGACPTGADAIAYQYLNAIHERYPAQWQLYGKRAGFVRNEQMLREGKPDLILAFRSEGKSRGTDMMIRLAQEAKVPVQIYRTEDVFPLETGETE